jgi:hypothetical protein
MFRSPTISRGGSVTRIGCYVDPFEFQRWVRCVSARPLEADSPLTRRARFRRWTDQTLAGYPENVLAKEWMVHKSCERQVRDDLR